MDKTRVCLGNGQSYRIGVSGAIEPMRISLDVPSGRWDFSDLSDLDMREPMHLDIVHESGRVWLRQMESGEAHPQAEGKVIQYITRTDALNAVKKDAIINARTMVDVRKLVKEAVEEAAAPKQKVAVDVEAGPIWSMIKRLYMILLALIAFIISFISVYYINKRTQVSPMKPPCIRSFYGYF